MTTAYDRFDSAGREKIECKECGLWYHRLDVHISKKHGLNVDAYLKRHPGSPTISKAASGAASEAAKEKSSSFRAPHSHYAPGVDVSASIPSTSVAAAATALTAAVVATDPTLFRIGVARLHLRTDLGDYDKQFVPAFDPHFSIGRVEKERWEYVGIGVQDRENVFIFGPTGCGKSESVMQLAAALNQPVRRINLHGEIRSSDFLGEKTVEVDAATGQAVVAWKDGILPDAMRRGHWLVLDELDAAPAHVLFVLQAVLEKRARARLVLPGNGGEVVEAHEHFRIIATGNTIGRGDESGLYTGTNMLNEAFLDRFGIIVQADYPMPATERDILVGRTGVNADDAVRMVSVAVDVRKALAAETVYCTFSTRRLITWAAMTVRLGDVKRAAVIAVTNRLSAEDAKFIAGLVQRYWG